MLRETAPGVLCFTAPPREWGEGRSPDEKILGKDELIHFTLYLAFLKDKSFIPPSLYFQQLSIKYVIKGVH